MNPLLKLNLRPGPHSPPDRRDANLLSTYRKPTVSVDSDSGDGDDDSDDRGS